MPILYICRNLKIPPVLLPGTCSIHSVITALPHPAHHVESDISLLYVNPSVFLLSESDRIVTALRWHFILSTVKFLVLVT